MVTIEFMIMIAVVLIIVVAELIIVAMELGLELIVVIATEIVAQPVVQW